MMSNQPEKIPLPPEPTKEQAQNPYAGRDHETGGFKSKSDVLAVAGLLGATARELGQIDTQNVGGDSQFIKAKKLNPKQALQTMVGNNPTQPVSDVRRPAVPRVEQTAHASSPIVEDTGLARRVAELEKVIESYKKISKFKRGISYTINTTSIKGEFKSPSDILDIVSSELAKGTKSITLKLNDTTKNR